MTKTFPLVSIIIVNYNGKHHLEKCLKSLSKVDYKNYEIILIDNNSSDGSIEFVKESYMSVIIKKLDKNYGFAEPNNIGAKMAKGELLLFLNNDTIVEPNFISELVKVINEDSKIAICQSLLLKPNGEIDSTGDFVNTSGTAYSSKDKVSEVREILSARGASMIVKKNIFWELDGLDGKFFASFEDVELGWKAWLYGYRVLLVPNSIVYHLGGQTIKNISSEVKFHGLKNIIILYTVYFGLTFTISKIGKIIVVGIIRRIFHAVFQNKPEGTEMPSLKIFLKSIMWILKNLKYVLDKRKKINSRKVRTNDDLIIRGLIKSS